MKVYVSLVSKDGEKMSDDQEEIKGIFGLIGQDEDGVFYYLIKDDKGEVLFESEGFEEKEDASYELNQLVAHISESMKECGFENKLHVVTETEGVH